MSGYTRLAKYVGAFVARYFYFLSLPPVAWLVATRRFESPPNFGPIQYGSLGLLAALLAAALFRQIRPLFSSTSPKQGVKGGLELGLALLTSVYAALQVLSVFKLDLYPVLYLLMTFLVFFSQVSVGVVCLAWAVSLETGMAAIGGMTETDIRAAATHCAFLLLFAVLYYILHWSDVRLRRLQHRADVAHHIKELEDQALGYRLITSRKDGTSLEFGNEERTRRLKMSGVLVIKKALTNQLQVLRNILKSRTVALFMLDTQGKNLRLVEASSDSSKLRSAVWIPAGEGLFGAVSANRAPVSLSSPRGDCSGVVWYEGRVRTSAAAAVPVFEEVGGNAHFRGVLVADREEELPFSDEELTLLQTMSAEAMRTIEVEQVVLDMDREKSQKEKFYEASRRLGEALSLGEVLVATVDAARTVYEYDFAAVTLVTDQEKQKQKIAHVFSQSKEMKELEGETFPEGSCLAASVVKLGVPLPSKDSQEIHQQGVFPPSMKLRDVDSVKVLPLTLQKRTIGTLSVGTSSRRHFGGEEMSMLLTVASMAAIAIENGKLYESMEQMATTDGLTGLYNHRVFQEKLDEAMARSKRSGKKLSVILMDIDHFKKVNDTHGHPAGDTVLKKVAKTLKDGARTTDHVARYGGEEFAIIMEETDQKGAKVKAERVREAVSKLPFVSDQGAFKVTVSLGISTFPDDASEKKELVVRSDEALYHAKHGGRNQSWNWHLIKKTGA